MGIGLEGNAPSFLPYQSSVLNFSTTDRSIGVVGFAPTIFCSSDRRLNYLATLPCDTPEGICTLKHLFLKQAALLICLPEQVMS